MQRKLQKNEEQPINEEKSQTCVPKESESCLEEVNKCQEKSSSTDGNMKSRQPSSRVEQP